jgi:aryl-alcohol dehydrogenase-like predicted oxidoreductase
MKTRQIGKSGLKSAAIGLGCMAMSEFYGASDELENLATLQAALDMGITMLDTADLYGDGQNEELLGRFLKQTSSLPVIASKCGIVRTNEILSDGNFRRDRNGHPDYIRSSCDNSLRRLGVNHIDLYYLHRVDPKVPVEDSMGALLDLKRAGKIGAIGLSEPSTDELRRAASVGQVDAVQSEYSLWTRAVEAETLSEIRRIGASLVCYSPLGRGLLRQAGQLPRLASDDFRRTIQRFTEDSLIANAPLFDLLDQAANETGVSVPQIMICWLLAQGEDIIPIPGARRLTHLRENVEAVDLELSEDWLTRLSAAFSPSAMAGARYTVGTALKTD